MERPSQDIELGRWGDHLTPPKDPLTPLSFARHPLRRMTGVLFLDKGRRILPDFTVYFRSFFTSWLQEFKAILTPVH